MKNKLIYITLAMMMLTITFASALGTWTDLRSTDPGNWVGTKQIISTAYDSTNGLIYTCLTAGGLGVYDLNTGIWTDLSGTDAGDWVGATANMGRCVLDPVTGYLYTGGSNGRFGYYDPNTNTWNSLMTADPGDWIGTTATGSMLMITFDSVDRKIYASYNANSKWGVYNITDGVFYDLSTSDVAGWTDALKVQYSLLDTQNDLLYMFWYSALTGGNNNDFGVYDLNTGVLTDKSSLIPWYETTQFISSGAVVNGKVYLGIGSNTVQAGLFGVYDPVMDTFTNLGSTDAGDWASNNDLSVLRADLANNKIYTIGYFCNANGNNFGVYDVNTNVWTNLMSADVSNWAYAGNDILNCTKYVTQATLDTVNERLYMFGYPGIMGVYDINANTIYDLSSTDPGDWMSGSTNAVGISGHPDYAAAQRVLNDGRVITAYATNYFGIYTFCMEDWIRTDVGACDGLIDDYTITYQDQNMCGTTNDLPADSGDLVDCCIESWVQHNATCVASHQMITFTDNNTCGTVYQLPIANGTTQVCGTSTGSSGGSNTRYLVDSNGTVVGTVFNNQVVTQQEKSSPFLSIGGGESFDIKTWWNDLWKSIKAFFWNGGGELK